MANDLDAANGRSPLNAVPQTQGPGGEGRSLARDFQPFQEIGAKIGGFGDTLNAVGDRMASNDEKAGLAAAKAEAAGAVMRDAQGNVTVQKYDPTTETGRAQNAMALQTGLANKESQIQTDLLAIRQAHDGDPQAFKAAADAYMRTIGQKDSAELRPFVRNTALNYADQHYRSLMTEKEKQTAANAQTALSSRLTDEQNSLYAMARGGGTETPEFQASMARIEDVYKAFGQNPAYGYPPERIRSEVANIRSKALGESIVGEVDRSFDKSGKAEAQRLLKDEILNNPKLNLTEQERGRLYSQGLSRLDYLSGERKAEVAAHGLLVKDYLDKAQKGQDTPDTVVDAIRDKALKLGDSDSVLKIDGMREAQRRTAGWKGLTDEQRMVRAAEGSTLRAPPALAPVFEAAAQKYGIPAGHLETFGKIESGFNPGAVNKGSGAAGLGQFIPSTWRQYGKGADPLNPEANVDATARLYLDNKRSLQNALGREPALWEIYAAHQQGAGAAGAMLKDPGGSAMATIARVRQSMGESPLTAASIAAKSIIGNGGRTNMTNDEFLGIWRKKVQSVAGGSAATAVAGEIKDGANPYTAPYALKIARVDEAAIVPAATTWAQSITKQVQAGFTPDPTVLASFYQIAAQYPEKLQGAERDLSSAITAKELADRVFNGEGGAPAGQSVIDRAKKIAADSGNLYEKGVLDRTQAIVDAGKENMAKEPAREAFNRGWIAQPPAPLNFSDPQALAAAIDQRAQASNAISARTGTPTGLFGKGDAEAIGAGVVGGSPEAASAFLGSLAKLDNDRLFSTLADPEMKKALASAANTRDPAKYIAVMGGLDALWRRNSDEFARAAGDGLFDAVQTYQARLGETPETLKKLLTNDSDGVEGKFADLNRDAAKKDWASYDPRKLGDAVKGWFSWGDRSPQDPKAAGAFMGDFLTIYQDRAVLNRGNLEAAKTQTIEKLRTMYQPSAVNGDRLMKLSPETTYRDDGGKPLTIEGSFDWMRDDIQTSIRQKLGLGADARMPAPALNQAQPEEDFSVPVSSMAVGAVSYELIPTPDTQADIASGSKRPRYAITFADPRTGEMHATTWQGDPTEHLVRQAVRQQTALDARRRVDETNPLLGGP